MNLLIRPAKIEDSSTIGKAQREIAEKPGFFCSLPSELTDESVQALITDVDKSENGIFIVAVLDNQLVGHAFLKPHSTKCLRHVVTLNIAVHKGWQNIGIGKKLLEYLIATAKNSSLTEKIELRVRATNLNAIHLYQQLGFIEEGRLINQLKIDDYYIDDFIMSLNVK